MKKKVTKVKSSKLTQLKQESISFTKTTFIMSLLVCTLLSSSVKSERIISLSQARAFSPESVAADLASISTPKCKAYLQDLQETEPFLVEDIMGIIMEDEDNVIGPQAQKIIDEVNNPKLPVSTTAMNLKAKDQKKYLSKRAKYTKKIIQTKVQAAKIIQKASKKFQSRKLTKNEFKKKLTQAVKPFKKQVKKWTKVKTKFVIKHAPRKYVHSYLKSNRDKRKVDRVSRQLHRTRTHYKQLLKKASNIGGHHSNGSKTAHKINIKLEKLDHKIEKLNKKKSRLVEKFNKGVLHRMKMGINNLKKIEAREIRHKKKLGVMNPQPIIKQQTNLLRLKKRTLLFSQIEMVQRRITRAKLKIAWCGKHKSYDGVEFILATNVRKLHSEIQKLHQLNDELKELQLSKKNQTKCIKTMFNSVKDKEKTILKLSSSKLSPSLKKAHHYQQRMPKSKKNKIKRQATSELKDLRKIKQVLKREEKILMTKIHKSHLQIPKNQKAKRKHHQNVVEQFEKVHSGHTKLQNIDKSEHKAKKHHFSEQNNLQLLKKHQKMRQRFNIMKHFEVTHPIKQLTHTHGHKKLSNKVKLSDYQHHQPHKTSHPVVKTFTKSTHISKTSQKSHTSTSETKSSQHLNHKAETTVKKLPPYQTKVITSTVVVHGEPQVVKTYEYVPQTVNLSKYQYFEEDGKEVTDPKLIEEYERKGWVVMDGESEDGDEKKAKKGK